MIIPTLDDAVTSVDSITMNDKVYIAPATAESVRTVAVLIPASGSADIFSVDLSFALKN